MDVEALVRVLKQEEHDASSFYTSELAKSQEEALNRYFGRPYGDELEGRSKVVSHDVEDAINWIMPEMMRTFTASEDLVSVKAQNPEDDAQYEGAPEGRSKVDVMAAYASHVFFEDNRGADNAYDFIFDGLLLRLGVLKVGWQDPIPGPPMLIEGVGEGQLGRYINDPEYEILGFDTEEGPNGLTFVLEVKRTPQMGRVHIEAVAPEEFAIDKLACSVDDSRYHRRRRRAYVSELAKRYPEHAETLKDRKPKDDDPGMFDARTQARTPDVNAFTRDASNDEGRAEVWLMEEYIRIDFDDDGTVELRHVKRVDDIVLENIAVPSSEYVCWTPSRVAHKIVGRSIFDMLADITRIRTVITRRYLDGLAQTITPRTIANRKALDQDSIDALEANDIGGVILVDGPVGEAMRETITPDVSGPALNALEYFDQRGAEATGVTKQAQGMDPTAMNKTATGIDLLQAAAKTRIEQFARWAGVAFEDVFKRILQLLAAHQDGPRMVKLFGQWVEVDPRTWADDMSVKVDIGSAGVSKAQRIANLNLIAQKQEQMLMTAGPTPIVGMQHLRNTYASMVSDMGFSDPQMYFGDIPPDWQPEPKPDPKQMEIQAKMQLEQGKAQVQAQADQQRMAHDREKAVADIQLAREKAAAEIQLAREKASVEFELAREKMQMETQLAIERMRLEAEQAERDSQRNHIAAVETAKARGMNGSGPGLSKDRPGGSLAQ
jgi:hypothetical protein